MSNTITTGVPGDQAEQPPTPTTTHYQQIAKQLSDALISAVALIPTFEMKRRGHGEVRPFSFGVSERFHRHGIGGGRC